jgi:acetyltransferase-like isoleucine patch superfamily enzyme
MTPTPFNLLFYKLMGMKIGRGVQLNTTHISDPCLIELGDKATIGGNATIIAHYAQGGFLVIAPVKIGAGATVGLRAIILGDVEIGEKAKILPNSVVLPKTRIPPGETWGGVPAKKIEVGSFKRKAS